MKSFTNSHRSNFRSFSLQHYSFLVWDIDFEILQIPFLIHSPTTYSCISHIKQKHHLNAKTVLCNKTTRSAFLLSFADDSWCVHQPIVLRPKSYLPQYWPSFHMHWETGLLLHVNFTYLPFITFYDFRRPSKPSICNSPYTSYQFWFTFVVLHQPY